MGLTSCNGESDDTRYESSGLQLELSDDMTYFIVAGIGTCMDVDLFIPNEYNGLPVKKIKEKAFKKNSGIQSVDLNENLREIENYAFQSCTNLKKIRFNESIEKVSSVAFESCSMLTEVYFDSFSLLSKKIDSGYITNSLETGYNLYVDNKLITETEHTGVYHNCISLTVAKTHGNYVLPGAFYGCTSLTSVVLSDSLEQIQTSTFSNCTSLTNLVIPSGLTSIGESAFFNCTSLSTITIPDSVTRIAQNAFFNCPALVLYDNAYYLGNESNPYKWLISPKMQLITNCKINASCEFIAEKAFSTCYSLKEIIIPDTITAIGYMTFKDCTSLKSATLGSGVKIIGQSSFEGCTSLQSINIPNGVTEISSSAFYKCSSLTAITIPDSVTVIDYYAFCFCKGLTNVILGTGIKSIKMQAFAFCNYLNIVYSGTSDQWNSIFKGEKWAEDVWTNVVHCSDLDASI